MDVGCQADLVDMQSQGDDEFCINLSGSFHRIFAASSAENLKIYSLKFLQSSVHQIPKKRRHPSEPRFSSTGNPRK